MNKKIKMSLKKIFKSIPFYEHKKKPNIIWNIFKFLLAFAISYIVIIVITTREEPIEDETEKRDKIIKTIFNQRVERIYKKNGRKKIFKIEKPRYISDAEKMYKTASSEIDEEVSLTQISDGKYEKLIRKFFNVLYEFPDHLNGRKKLSKLFEARGELFDQAIQLIHVAKLKDESTQTDLITAELLSKMKLYEPAVDVVKKIKDDNLPEHLKKKRTQMLKSLGDKNKSSTHKFAHSKLFHKKFKSWRERTALKIYTEEKQKRLIIAKGLDNFNIPEGARVPPFSKFKKIFSNEEKEYLRFVQKVIAESSYWISRTIDFLFFEDFLTTKESSRYFKKYENFTNKLALYIMEIDGRIKNINPKDSSKEYSLHNNLINEHVRSLKNTLRLSWWFHKDKIGFTKKEKEGLFNIMKDIVVANKTDFAKLSKDKTFLRNKIKETIFKSLLYLSWSCEVLEGTFKIKPTYGKVQRITDKVFELLIKSCEHDGTPVLFKRAVSLGDWETVELCFSKKLITPKNELKMRILDYKNDILHLINGDFLKERELDGGAKTYLKFSDGQKTLKIKLRREKCPYCKGSGECRRCEGTGKSKSIKDKICSKCNGSGRCKYCNGSGETEEWKIFELPTIKR